MKVIGIDPGMRGGIAILDTETNQMKASRIALIVAAVAVVRST